MASLIKLLPAAMIALGLALTIMTGGFGDAGRDGRSLAIVVIGGLAGGSVLIAMIGRLLSREWLDLIEDELLPAGGMVLLACVLCLAGELPGDPFSLSPTDNRALWFTPTALWSRFALFAALVAGLCIAMTTLRGYRRKVAALGLPLLASAFALVAVDFSMLVAPIWWSALVPIGWIANQLTGALSLAFCYHLAQRERGEPEEFASMAAALLSLAGLDLWIGIVQYLIAWYGNLPEAALYYEARSISSPWAMEVAAFCQTLAALVLLVTRARLAMLAAAALLLVAYGAQAIWRAGGLDPTAAMAFGGLLVVWLGGLGLVASRYDRYRKQRKAFESNG